MYLNDGKTKIMVFRKRPKENVADVYVDGNNIET